MNSREDEIKKNIEELISMPKIFNQTLSMNIGEGLNIEVKSLNKLLEYVSGDDIGYAKYLFARHKYESSFINASWFNSNNESKSCKLIHHVIERLTAEMNYEDTIKYLLKHQREDIFYSFTGDLLLKRAKDAELYNDMCSDNKLLPILFFANEEAKNQVKQCFSDFPDKPLSDTSKQWLCEDRLNIYGFDNQSLTDFQRDILEVDRLLTDKDLIMEQLDHLDKALIEAIKKSNPEAKLPLADLYGKEYTLFKKPYIKEKDKPFLFYFFHAWAKESGFSNVTKVEAGLSVHEFNEMLKQSIIFKDKAFEGTYHGAWTHLIQWYCIVGAHRNGKIKLTHTPGDLYKKIGEEDEINRNDSKRINQVWQMLVDGGPRSNSAVSYKYDFRDVDQVNLFLYKDEEFAKRCPTLQAMISYRTLKKDRNKLNK